MKPRTPHCLRKSIFAVTLIAMLLSQAPATFACGPFALDAVFSFSKHPEYPLEKFAGGDLGIVPPSYARSYLYVAYRYLRGNGFDQAEQKALVNLWRERLDSHWEPGEEQAVKTWFAAREKISGVGSAPKIEVFRNREKPNEYDYYLNCQNDAFETAAATLDARIAHLGADHASLKQWVEAQDQVFANCSEGQHVPADVPPDADALARADRRYQIAAANFYAGNFAVAKKLFESIAADTQSPWRVTAAYLVARASLRMASLGPEESKKEALSETEQQLKKILSSREMQAFHPAAKRLLNFVSIRLHPEERLHELAISLADNGGQASFKQDLWDYTVLLDGFIGDDEGHHQKTKTPVAVLQGDDLTDWIVTFQSADTAALEHSLARWEATPSLPWLIAALSKVDARHPKAARLQEAAAKIPATSPAFPSASFHAIRLDIAAGRLAEARTRLDDSLGQHRSRFNTSSLNLLEQERMIVASNLDDFLVHAQRLPAAFTWDEDGRELPAEKEEISRGAVPLAGKPLFDTDAASMINRRLPLALLSEAANSNRLPEHLRRDVSQAAWLRSVLLGDHATAMALVPTLRTTIPQLSPFLDVYTSASDPAAKNFAATHAWLKFPGLEPVVDRGVGRERPLDQQDTYRDNWWCSAAYPETDTSGAESEQPLVGISQKNASPRFLTNAQQSSAAREYATLTSLGAAPNYLSRQVLAWATKHPTDPRVPEALHLAVKTTRYGCTDKETGKWSKAAYDFLHRRYPRNTWTKQTPYWFKD